MNRSSFNLSKSAKTSSSTPKTSRSASKKIALSEQPQLADSLSGENSLSGSISSDPREIFEQLQEERKTLLENARQKAKSVSRAQHNRQSKQSEFNSHYGDSI